MSVLLMGAVFHCGPPEQTPAFIMLAIADNADDYGFACPSHDTIAAKARCDRQTVIRHLKHLEGEGWLRTAKKLINGKGNAYFLNLQKLGVTLSPETRRSALHTALIKRHGDNLIPISAPEKSGNTKPFSGDNPQPPQVTFAASQVTKEGGSSITRCDTNHLTHEPSFVEPSADLNFPPTPQGGQEDFSMRWSAFKLALKQYLASMPETLMEAKGFREIRAGQSDYDVCFRDWWLVEVQQRPQGYVFITHADEEGATEAGMVKYSARIERLAKNYFQMPRTSQLSFVLLPRNYWRVHIPTPNPAA